MMDFTAIDFETASEGLEAVEGAGDVIREGDAFHRAASAVQSGRNQQPVGEALRRGRRNSAGGLSYAEFDCHFLLSRIFIASMYPSIPRPVTVAMQALRI